MKSNKLSRFITKEVDLCKEKTGKVIAEIEHYARNFSMSEGTSGKIGELNGKWSLLFRAFLGALVFLGPSMIALQIWFVTTIHRITVAQAEIKSELSHIVADTNRNNEVNMLRLRNEILSEVDKGWPPPWLRNDISDIKKDAAETKARVSALERKSP